MLAAHDLSPDSMRLVLASDQRKQKALESRGFVVERFTRDEVFGEARSVAGRTRRALAA